MSNLLTSYLIDIPLDKKMLVINCVAPDTMVVCVSDKHNIKYEPIKEDIPLKLTGELNRNGNKKPLSTVSITVNPRMIENTYETYFKKFVDNYHSNNIDFLDEYSSFSVKYLDKSKGLEILLRIEDESGNKLN